MILLLSIRELICIQFTSLFHLIAENLLCKIAQNRNSPIFRAMKFEKRSTTKEKICAFFHKNCAKVGMEYGHHLDGKVLINTPFKRFTVKSLQDALVCSTLNILVLQVLDCFSLQYTKYICSTSTRLL